MLRAFHSGLDLLPATERGTAFAITMSLVDTA
jgi:hypothetical protein